MIGHEVADAYGVNLAVGKQLLQRLVGLHSAVESARKRLVQDQQVDLVDAELGRALVEGVERGVVAVIADPDLCFDEDLAAIKTRSADARRPPVRSHRRPRCRYAG